MAAAVLCQVGGGGGAPAHASALSCLGFLLALLSLPLLSYGALKIRRLANRSGSEKPDFTSIRSTGKTVVNAPFDDDDDSGIVN